ncbi:hypothetical protein B0J14DRAFT_556840 [Halenospora varia]|nr:hypothetical protein B0J14DRAFT_556840 [Halenospora varia]
MASQESPSTMSSTTISSPQTSPSTAELLKRLEIKEAENRKKDEQIRELEEVVDTLLNHTLHKPAAESVLGTGDFQTNVGWNSRYHKQSKARSNTVPSNPEEELKVATRKIA